MFIFKVTEPSSIPYRTHPACAKRAAVEGVEGIWEIQGGWSKQIWLRLYLKLVAVVGFLIQILNNILNLL